jgi:divalent metal cation (Fe/Co/Zn/Cd) transporter
MNAKLVAAPSDILRTAIRLELATIVWMIIEAAVAIGAGVAARSLLLFVFGIDSAIELSSALIVFWRLKLEWRGDAKEAGRIAKVERKAAQIAGCLLLLLSVYVLADAIYGLVAHHAAEISLIGISVAVISAIAMPLLGRAKINIADRMESRSLRADAMEAFACGYLAWVLLAGLVINALTDWWWIDSAASLAIIPLLVHEGWEAISERSSSTCHNQRD